jgi:hypothetical protein
MEILKLILSKAISLIIIAVVFTFGYAAYETWIKEPEDPKKTWYWADQCLQERVTYRSFEKNGTWKFELANDMVGDAVITFEIYNGQGESQEFSQVIKAGTGSGLIPVKFQCDEAGPKVNIVSVIMMENGKESYILDCVEK